MLGRIIEKVTGLPYGKYVQQSVLAPMGVRHMQLGRSLREYKLAEEVCYYQPGEVTRSIFPESHGAEVSWCYGGFNIEAMDAHGGWLASAIDLVRFATALDTSPPTPLLKERGAGEEQKPLLTPQSSDLMYARPAPPLGLTADGRPEQAYYGFGWSVRPVGPEQNRQRNIWHNGSLPGTNTWLIRRYDGLTWAMLFNQRSHDPKLPDTEIDGAMHRAAAAVKNWPV